MSGGGGNNIKVVCRVRPQNKREIAENGTVVVELDDNDVTIRLDNGADIKQDFTFDRVFGMQTQQQEIFDYSIRSTVEDVLNGYNGTVFAYGQTGSGKTFTMMGADIDNEQLRGVIPRIAETIFTSIMAMPPTMEYTVKVSFMEIYMEKIRDLLNPQNDNLPVHEEKNRGVYVKGLLEIYVSSLDEVYEVLRRGSAARIVSYTSMNAESSRSHSIFVVTITQKNLSDGSIKSGRLYLVDLAGSEKVGKTGASGQTLEEAKKINKSLTSLGMVINALTDGKSKHIPYRDSKLTRILQESLGGNSRTTLIINCSPSSFNDVETLSTLRFGMRAKSIKNKAKANVDLSPAELKALLKKAKSAAVTFKSYINALEGEVSVWRSGGTVPEEKYAKMEAIEGVAPASQAPPAAAPQQTSPPPQASAPSATDPSSRAPTPPQALADEEREEFLKRENELMDQIAEKETDLTTQTKLAEQLTEELTMWKTEGTQLREENKGMNAELSTLRVQLDKITYESKDTKITLDSANEANQELNRQVQELKEKIAEVRQSQKDFAEEERAKKRSEKMARMMQELDSSGAFSAKEKELRDTLLSLESMEGESALTSTEAEQLRKNYAEAKTAIEQQEQMIAELSHENSILSRKRDELEIRYSKLEFEYEELLEKTIAEEEAIEVAETLHDLKAKIEAQYNSKREQQQNELNEINEELERKNEDLRTLNASLTDLKRINEELQAKVTKFEQIVANRSSDGRDVSGKEQEMERIRKTMAQQLAEFELMKKSLMRDLQQRCEKVVELEISLDETREQYNNLLRQSNNKAQQKKMAFLERNLEQLTHVQKQLVEHNSGLKKEFSIAERKLIARNERIQSLEQLLQDAQNKLATQNQKFESQLQAVRERLEQARSTKNLPPNYGAGFNFGRIAKPMRGGGAIATADDSVPELSTIPPAKEKAPVANKRKSWLWGSG